jgi:hypothetical protein
MSGTLMGTCGGHSFLHLEEIFTPPEADADAKTRRANPESFPIMNIPFSQFDMKLQ